MRKVRVVLVLSVFLFLVSCAGVQEKWNALTPDQKARIIVNDLQDQLTHAFDTGKAYVTANPKYQDKWKAEIVPAFDVANKALASVIAVGKTKPLTPEFVYGQAQAVVNNVLNLLVQIGALKKGG